MACPFFGRCGGCQFDITDPEKYKEEKLAVLPRVGKTATPITFAPGGRIRADMAFGGGQFGFYKKNSKIIIPITNCINLHPEINNVLPQIAQLPFTGAGACMVTMCKNGIDIAITSNVLYFTNSFRTAASALPPEVIRVTWNGATVFQSQQPIVSFDNHDVEYPCGAFLQPTIESSDELRRLVVSHAQGAKRVADLFCGLGNFTFALNADGFDIVGTGLKRDLMKHPLTQGMLAQYDCVVMDPPRAGALAQCRELAKSNVNKIIYVSCNPNTFIRDSRILQQGGYVTVTIVPVDQFVGSAHWELVAVFHKVGSTGTIPHTNDNIL